LTYMSLCRHVLLIKPSQFESPDNFEAWEALVRAAEGLEGGLNRNSSPQAISATREIYDRFLAKFPLFFGYWKKYADLEFSIAGTEAAEMVTLLSSPLLSSPLGLQYLIPVRSTNAAWRASQTRSTSGQIIADSKWKHVTTRPSFESKYTSKPFLDLTPGKGRTHRLDALTPQPIQSIAWPYRIQNNSQDFCKTGICSHPPLPLPFPPLLVWLLTLSDQTTISLLRRFNPPLMIL
jgi:hypothetical protein